METSKELNSDKRGKGVRFGSSHKKKHKKSKKKSKKRKYSSSDDSDKCDLKSTTHKKKLKKLHKHYKNKSDGEKCAGETSITTNAEDRGLIGPEIPPELLQKAQSMAPMSKEEWEKKQNTIRRVFDEKTGRSRLVRGEGEIVEEIVSRERHLEINRQATLGDGNFFQSNLKKNIT